MKVSSTTDVGLWWEPSSSPTLWQLPRHSTFLGLKNLAIDTWLIIIVASHFGGKTREKKKSKNEQTELHRNKLSLFHIKMIKSESS